MSLTIESYKLVGRNYLQCLLDQTNEDCRCSNCTFCIVTWFLRKILSKTIILKNYIMNLVILFIWLLTHATSFIVIAKKPAVFVLQKENVYYANFAAYFLQTME